MFHSCSLSTSSFCIATDGSTVQVSVQANAMNQAFDTTAAGQAVPYLSYALAIQNFAGNPEQARLTDAGTYVGKAVNDGNYSAPLRDMRDNPTQCKNFQT